ncbi:13397_t:CDS:2, partial [Racocetra fulgida]
MENAVKTKPTTLEELKRNREKLQFRKTRFEKRNKAKNGSPDLCNKSLSQCENSAHRSDTISVRSSTASVNRFTVATASSKEPSCTVYEKLILDYLTKGLHNVSSLPLDSYDLLKSDFRIPFTQTSLKNLETALKALSNTWGPKAISVKEKKINGSKRLIVEEVDSRKLNAVKVIESALDSEDPSSLEKSLQLTTYASNDGKKRKIDRILDDDDDDASKEINELLAKPSFKELEENGPLHNLCVMLNKKSSQDKLIIDMFDFSILGKFTVIMADPPWDIHMTLPYGTMTDDEMKAMEISTLQDEGLLMLEYLGVTIQIDDLKYFQLIKLRSLYLISYDRADELVWIKTNQLQRLIRTGRTGHWLNHSKEHCLVGIKGNPEDLNLGLDCDVLVGEVRETSRKPDEIYGLIDRLAPGTRKL